MSGRPPGAHYNIIAGNRLVASTLHDLNTADSRNGDIEAAITDAARDDAVAASDSLENEEESHSEAAEFCNQDCVAQSYGNSLQQLQDAEHQSMTLEQEQQQQQQPGSPYGVLDYHDLMPIEAARARFLQLIIDHFIQPRIYAVSDSPESSYSNQNGKDKEHKRKTNEVHYEGDSRYLLPLTFVANLYETLIAEIDARLHTVEDVHEKTMGVALEASGGLYRKLVKKYPKSGGNMSFKRREMASALEAKTKFPQLVRGDEKRVRFVVVHGLELVEQPHMPPEDAEWFKRLTGRHEAAITARDYNFYSARVKHRRLNMRDNASPAMHPQQQYSSPSDTTTVISSHSPLPQLSSRIRHSQQDHHQQQHQQQQHQQIIHTPQTPPHQHQHQHHQQQQQQLHSGMGMLAVTPDRFCDECGAPYNRETSKFCSKCGTKRLFGLQKEY